MKHRDSCFRVLSECANGYIGICECCLEFNFAYKTVLLSFQEEEMLQFFQWVIGNRSSRDYYMPLRHGRNRVYCSPHSNLFLTYDDDELDEITRLHNEAVLLWQVQKTLLTNRMNWDFVGVRFNFLNSHVCSSLSTWQYTWLFLSFVSQFQQGRSERYFYEQLYRADIKTVPQYQVGQYSLDLALFDGDRKLDIEIDGEKYHRNWDGELVKRDQLRNRRLIELGLYNDFWAYEGLPRKSQGMEKEPTLPKDAHTHQGWANDAVALSSHR